MRRLEQGLKVCLVLVVALGLIVSIVGSMVNPNWFVTADQFGYRDFQAGEFGRALEQFDDRQWKASALYRDGEFRLAAEHFAGGGTADSEFNQATALLMHGKYTDAVARYQSVLERRPSWEAAKVNLAIAQARAARVKKTGGEMTGGMMAADEVAFGQGEPGQSGEQETIEGVTAGSPAELQAIWLRQVQTRPADFLRAKFAYQYGETEQ